MAVLHMASIGGLFNTQYVIYKDGVWDDDVQWMEVQAGFL